MTPLQISASAINKFMYYSWNYQFIRHTWKSIGGEERTEYVPEFLTKVKWNCNFDHMLSKWNSAVFYYGFDGEKKRERDAHGFFSRFYAELDGENRLSFLTWILDNYNGECKFGFERELLSTFEA